MLTWYYESFPTLVPIYSTVICIHSLGSSSKGEFARVFLFLVETKDIEGTSMKITDQITSETDATYLTQTYSELCSLVRELSADPWDKSETWEKGQRQAWSTSAEENQLFQLYFKCEPSNILAYVVGFPGRSTIFAGITSLERVNGWRCCSNMSNPFFPHYKFSCLGGNHLMPWSVLGQTLIITNSNWSLLLEQKISDFIFTSRKWKCHVL